jgi:hypothetical protein
MRWDEKDKCDACGRFIKYDAPGVSWSRTWSYDMSGTPDLHDPRYRCGQCTTRRGPLQTNCAHPDRYSGINLSLSNWE